MTRFAQRLIDWQPSHGRHDLPWQQTADPYRVWLSEIMLQQTQVTTVMGYYQRFLAHFPNLATLAAAPLDEVMALWSGLGYYARARNLHACARILVSRHAGVFPRDPVAIAGLPGIGRSTANAIAAFCFGAAVPILDGNVKRLLCRHFGIVGHPAAAAVTKRLWHDATALLPAQQVAIYIQAQMDIGATICTRSKPVCPRCPVMESCIARRDNRIAELPTPRPRRAVPQRAVTLLVLCHAQQILLEARPPRGIWGGLLSLPALVDLTAPADWPNLPGVTDLADLANFPARPAPAAVAAYCAQHLGVPVVAVTSAPTITHRFSHFCLHLQPLLCTAADDAPAVAAAPLRWVARTALAQMALPAPIRTLLSAIP